MWFSDHRTESAAFSNCFNEAGIVDKIGDAGVGEIGAVGAGDSDTSAAAVLSSGPSSQLDIPTKYIVAPRPIIDAIDPPIMIGSFVYLRRSDHIFYAVISTGTKTLGTIGRGSMAILISFASSPTNTRWGMQICACLGKASRLLLAHQFPDGRLPHRCCKSPLPPREHLSSHHSIRA